MKYYEKYVTFSYKIFLFNEKVVLVKICERYSTL